MRAEHSTSIRVRPADWHQARQRVKATDPSATAYNDSLKVLPGLATSAKNRLEALGEPVTAAAVAALLKNPKALQPGPAPCLLDFMETELQQHYLGGNRGSYETLRAVVSKLRAWHGPARLPLAELTPARVEKFYRHLLSAKARGGEVTTANKAVVNLVALFRRGIKQALWSEAQNPFSSLRKKKAVRRPKVRLTQAEMQALREVQLCPTGWLWRARAAYLLQFYLRGERIGACLLLRWQQDVRGEGTRIEYQAQKDGPFKQVPVRGELAALLACLRHHYPASAYVLPYLPARYHTLSAAQQLTHIKKATATINNALKEVVEQAGIDKKLSTHAARRTFATLGRKVVGVGPIQQMLGHTTERMTQQYLDGMDFDEQDAAADAIFDSLL